MDKRLYQAKMGAVCGDVVGSIYERYNIKHKLAPEEFIKPESTFTDDTVMTLAVARGLMHGLIAVMDDWRDPLGQKIIGEYIRDAVVEYGKRYPEAGYGSRFIQWLDSDDHAPYNSWANGSAMRASYAGWFARSLKEAEILAELSAAVTHNHPEGIKGAVAVAGSVYLLRTGGGKAAVRDYASRFYDLNFTVDDIRDSYQFDVSCTGSVPQAILAFLEAESYTDAVALGISIGGDSDTIAAIAGSLAEVIYPIPDDLREAVAGRLDKFLLKTLLDAEAYMSAR